MPISPTSPVTIVTGLPRSGTSLMMKILDEGGLETVQDHIRKADIDNPNGYYEFEKVKRIKEDTTWLPETCGKVFKMVSLLLFHLPADYRYKLVFMRRDIREIIASQNKMLERLKKPPTPVSDDEIAALFTRHLQVFDAWVAGQKNFEMIYVWYNDLMQQPEVEVARLNQFLGSNLNVDKMAGVVDPCLYRNRCQSRSESVMPTSGT